MQYPFIPIVIEGIALMLVAVLTNSLKIRFGYQWVLGISRVQILAAIFYLGFEDMGLQYHKGAMTPNSWLSVKMYQLLRSIFFLNHLK